MFSNRQSAQGGLRRCPCCGGSLEFHQPDLNDPDRLLGVCQSCPSWSSWSGTTGRAFDEAPRAEDRAWLRLVADIDPAPARDAFSIHRLDLHDASGDFERADGTACGTLAHNDAPLTVEVACLPEGRGVSGDGVPRTCLTIRGDAGTFEIDLLVADAQALGKLLALVGAVQPADTARAARN